MVCKRYLFDGLAASGDSWRAADETMGKAALGRPPA